MQLKEIRHHQLQNYIDSEEYKQSQTIAISKHRALSHIRNPRANSDDLVLVLLYENQEMLAYLGVFADDLHFDTGTEHVGWLSCMWVNPIMRGKGIAKKLLQTVFEAWQYKILVTEFTPAAKGLYHKTQQFVDLAKPKGIRAYLRLNLAYLLPQKDTKWTKWKPLLATVDGLFNIGYNLKLKFYQINCPLFEYLAEIDAESEKLIQNCKKQKKELMNRTPTDLKWLVNNPWLLNSSIKDHNAKRYHFSAVASFFTFLNVKIYDDNKKVIAFIILAIRDKSMKVPYAYFEEAATKKVVQVIYTHLLKMNLNILTIFNPRLVAYIKNNPSPFFKKRKFERHYIIGKVLEDKLKKMPTFEIQDGDADAAFT